MEQTKQSSISLFSVAVTKHLMLIIKEKGSSWVLVAHAYNPSYLGG
jgi:hypothetical protein